MDILKAYWRMDYVTAPKREGAPRGNPFVELAKSEDDREALILFRGEGLYVLLNRFPYNPGHLMVLPYREVRTCAISHQRNGPKWWICSFWHRTRSPKR